MGNDELKCFATETSLLIAVVDHEAPERELGGRRRGREQGRVAQHDKAYEIAFRVDGSEPGFTVKVCLSHGDCIAGYVVLLLGGDSQVSYCANRRRGDFVQRNLSRGGGGG